MALANPNTRFQVIVLNIGIEFTFEWRGLEAQTPNSDCAIRPQIRALRCAQLVGLKETAVGPRGATYTAMTTELLDREHRAGECPTCIKTQRMVSAVVAGTLDNMVAWTEEGDLESAGSAASKFLNVVAQTPASTVDLVGAENIARLTMNVEAALAGIENGDAGVAVCAFRLGMANWFETYPPYRV